MPFKSLDELRTACLELPTGSEAAANAVARRQDTLTKPQGSLGRLETIAAWLARWQGRDMPKLDRVKVFVFAGNHGVTAQGVSAYPSEVTVQMVANFAGGGAAINQLARIAGAELDVIPLDLDQPTGDFTQTSAMDEKAFLVAVSAGYDAVTKDIDLVCFGEMGIGNTTPAAAISAALFGGGAEKWTGRGTGVDDAGLKRKVVAIEAGLKRHAAALADPLGIAAGLGGRELAAIFGA
ncbi:nicotinate-nucleotide--dimethylbenzimidazole phosphoribosyltransferase, partial [Mesorhizobium sp. M8A.F.Ca.ET.059.01.1.1]